MADLSNFNPDSVGNPDYNIFGLPTEEEDARLIILPVPWQVTVSYRPGTARAPDHIMAASYQVDLFDKDFNKQWREGYYMRKPDQKILTKSDYLRKEAELYINYVASGEQVADNRFMAKTLKDINEGSVLLNEWVYQQSAGLLNKGKLVALLGEITARHLGTLGQLQKNIRNLAFCR